VPLELGCMEAPHLSSMACKVSATDRPKVGNGKRRGQQVKQLGANGCLVAKVFFFFWVTGELSTLRLMTEVPNEPDLSPNTGLQKTS